MNLQTIIILLTILISLMFLFDSIECARLFRKCSSPHGKILSISVSNCSETDPFCPFVRGENVTLNLTFIPNVKSNSVKVKIIGEIAKIPLPFAVSPNEACDNYGVKCPLVPEKRNNFLLELPIRKIYPPVSVIVVINLIDETETNVACIRFKAKILKSRKDSAQDNEEVSEQQQPKPHQQQKQDNKKKKD
ncbi:alpha-crystallin B chain [Sarcoptes scabiei]|nr:alpha-crystallin B chain [Sarcoptes scabiei]